MAVKNLIFLRQKIEIQIFCQKMFFFWRFFDRSLAKSRRTAKRQTVLSSFRPMLTILITLGKIYFLTNFRLFYSLSIFATIGKNLGFLDFNANG